MMFLSCSLRNLKKTNRVEKKGHFTPIIVYYCQTNDPLLWTLFRGHARTPLSAIKAAWYIFKYADSFKLKPVNAKPSCHMFLQCRTSLHSSMVNSETPLVIKTSLAPVSNNPLLSSHFPFFSAFSSTSWLTSPYCLPMLI